MAKITSFTPNRLSLVKDGKEIKWKNMDKIWEYAGNKDKFIDYVKSGVVDFYLWGRDRASGIDIRHCDSFGRYLDESLVP